MKPCEFFKKISEYFLKAEKRGQNGWYSPEIKTGDFPLETHE